MGDDDVAEPPEPPRTADVIRAEIERTKERRSRPYDRFNEWVDASLRWRWRTPGGREEILTEHIEALEAELEALK